MAGWSGGVLGSSAAMARTAEAMLRAVGGDEVYLRLRGGTATDSATANPRLGLASEFSEDVAFSPAVIRDEGRGRMVCVISARAVQGQVELRQTETAQALFDAALGIVHQGKLLRIAGVTADMFGGAPYLYRVTIEE